MHNYIAVLAGLISIIGVLPYIRDTLRGKTHPNIVTWFTWTLLNVVYVIAAIQTGATQTAIFAGGSAISTGAICLIGLKYGVKKYTKFDIACQISALVGVVLWILTNRPAVAVLVSLATDFAGWLPTFRHAWIAPDAETWQTFAFSAVSSFLTLFAIQDYTFVALGAPVYILCANLALILTILLRRKRLALQK